MIHLISINNAGCSLNFNDEDGISYKGNIKEVALMFARHIYTNYNGYITYIINNTIEITYAANAQNKFQLIWIKTSDIPQPKWWDEFKNVFDKTMKMKAFM